MNHVVVFKDTDQVDMLVEMLDEHLADVVGGETVYSDDTPKVIADVVTALKNAEGRGRKFVVLTTEEVDALHEIVSEHTDAIISGEIVYSDPHDAYFFSNVRSALFTARIFDVGQVDS